MAEDLDTKNYALEMFDLFGSTKRHSDLPPRSKYDPHHPNNVTTPSVP